MPGHANTFSTIKAPLSRYPICRPTIVIVGMRAVRNACRITTVNSGRPFARAKRT